MTKPSPSSLAARLEALARHIEAHAEQPLPLAVLAAQAALSPAHLQRRFKAHFGLSPKQYQDGCRLRRLRTGLKAGTRVTDAIDAAGFGSTSRVYGEPARHLGMTPSRYRGGGRGERIAYVCADTVEGPLMLAATDAGLCFAEFGTDAAELRGRLQKEFPAAECAPAKADLAQLSAWLSALDDHLRGTAAAPDLPLDLRGTAFQLKVWHFLRTLAPGTQVTYTEVAHAIGAPRAVRAAASACGANRIAVLVPCHRVLRGDGGLGGYRWGVERKRRLLNREAGATQ